MRFLSDWKCICIAVWAGLCSLLNIAQAQVISDSAFEDIVITGVKSDIKRTNATEYIVVLDSIDLKIANAATVEDLLKTVAGLSLTSYMTGTQLSINGLSGAYTKVLLNGIPVIEGEQAGGLNLENIPINDVERIEIVKGSGSALYGSDAIGGVVNIITKKNRGSRIASVELRQRYSSNIGSSKWDRPGFSEIEPRDGDYSHWAGILNGSVSVSHNNELFGVRADAGYYFDAGAVDTIEKRPASIYKDRPYYSIPRDLRRNIRIAFNTDKAFINSLKTSFVYSDNLRRSSVTNNQKLTLNTKRIGADIQMEQNASENISFDGYVSAQQYKYERTCYNFDNRAVSEQETACFPALEAEAKTIVRAGGSHKLLIGINGGYEAVKAQYIKNGHKSGTQLAPFVQDIINIRGKDRVVVTPGLRFTWNSRFSNAFIPSFGARFNLFPSVFFRLAAGGGYKAPTFKDNYRDEWVHTGGIFVLSGNTDLKPERSWSINSGAGGKLKGKFSWEFGVHATRITDQITTRQTSPDTGITARGEHYETVRQYVNQDSAFTRGVDIALQFDLTSTMRFKTSYSLLDSKYWDESGRLSESQLYSRHTIKTSIYYSPGFFENYKPLLISDAVWQSAQKYESSSNGELPVFADINMAVELPVFFPDAKLILGVKNLLDNAIEKWGQKTGRNIFVELNLSVGNITRLFTKH